jgi:hypothetical protein
VFVGQKPAIRFRPDKHLPGGWTHFVAAGPDQRSDSDDEILRAAAEFEFQCCDSTGHDSCGRTAPASVDCGHGSSRRRSNQDRRAVRHAHGDGSAAIVGQQRVSLYVPGERFAVGDSDHSIPVYLVDLDDA